MCEIIAKIKILTILYLQDLVINYFYIEFISKIYIVGNTDWVFIWPDFLSN